MSRLITVKMNHPTMGYLDLDVDAKISDEELEFSIKSGEVVTLAGAKIRDLTDDEIKALDADDEAVNDAVAETVHDVMNEGEDPGIDLP